MSVTFPTALILNLSVFGYTLRSYQLKRFFFARNVCVITCLTRAVGETALFFLSFFFKFTVLCEIAPDCFWLQSAAARSHKESFQSEPLLEVSRSNRSIQCAATCRSRRWSDKRVLVELRLDEARKQDLKKPTRSARNSFRNCRNS